VTGPAALAARAPSMLAAHCSEHVAPEPDHRSDHQQRGRVRRGEVAPDLERPLDPGGRARAGFARATVQDWLAVLAASQPPTERNTTAAPAQRTVVLAVLRGALLDLLATGVLERTTAAVHQQLAALRFNGGHTESAWPGRAKVRRVTLCYHVDERQAR
jgi:hypothetical protein